MAEQFSFPGFDAKNKPTDRILFGIVPATPDATQLRGIAHSLRTKHGLSGSPLLPGHFHVTLCHIGDYHGLPTHIVAQAKETAAKNQDARV